MVHDETTAIYAGTRVALGIGVGLLISDRFNRKQRRSAGSILAGVGAITTIPLAVKVLRKKTELAHIRQKHVA